MSKIVLIPGFATNVSYGRRERLKGFAGFRAFAPMVQEGTAAIFRWGIETHAGFLQSINPFFFLPIYRQERAMIERRDEQEKLSRFLEREQPEVIVCHSLGTWFLLLTMKTFPLPPSVRHIVFNQSDIPASVLRQEADHFSVPLVNTYCFLDPHLWSSWWLSDRLRSGLRPVLHPNIHNVHFHLTPWHFHLSALRSSSFVALVLATNEH